MSPGDEVLERLVDRHGRTYADQLGIPIQRGGPSELFQLLVGALLMSARIDADIAVAASRALFDRGYTDPRGMLEATWQDRVDALGAGHYVRYDESTATHLADTSQLLVDRYDGDLRQLREEAGGGPRAHPRARAAGEGDRARRRRHLLSLGDTPAALASRYGDDDLARLTSALVRARLADDLEVVREGGAAAPIDTQLAVATRDELYAMAQERDVAGRSSMDRDELVQALRT